MKPLPLILAMLLLACALPQQSLPFATAAPEQSSPTNEVPIERVPALPRSPLGVNSHLASRYNDCATLDVPVDVLAGAQVGWAREDFQFSRIARSPDPAQWFWTCSDRAVELLTARGIAVLGVLNGPSPGWAVGSAEEASRLAPPADAFAAFAAAVAARYQGRVAAWQIWNEPDNALYWGPAPDPAAYAAVLRATASAIRAADPQATVVLGGLVAPDPARGFLQAVYDAGAWDAFDVVAVNPYADPWGPEDGQIGAVGVGAVKALVDRLGLKPLWATEFGWSTGPADRTTTGGSPVDEATQAQYLVRAMSLLLAAGAERVFWYKLKDTDPTNNLYGLLRYGAGSDDFDAAQHKAALAALPTLSGALGGATGAELRLLGQTSVVADWEVFGNWRRGDQPNGTLTPTDAERRSGSTSARLDYSFPTGGNDFVVFLPDPPLALPGAPDHVSLYLKGDGSGHELKVWLQDGAGELLQFRLGAVGTGDWRLLEATLDDAVEPYNQVTRGAGAAGNNLRLDPPLALVAIGLDDAPDAFVGSGTIYLDDLAVTEGAVYNVHLTGDAGPVDVVWALRPANAVLPLLAAQAAVSDASGATTTLATPDGQLPLAR
jgi:polysaccharide biosynthesis protein PslG